MYIVFDIWLFLKWNFVYIMVYHMSKVCIYLILFFMLIYSRNSMKICITFIILFFIMLIYSRNSMKICITFIIFYWIYFNHIKLRSLTLARVLSNSRKVHKSEHSQHIFPKLCTHVHRPFSTHLSQRNK